MSNHFMRIGVVSDTHGHMANTLQAVAQLSELNVDVVLHCGDIGSPSIVPLFAGWPTHFVLGNVDHDESGLRWIVGEEGQAFHGRFARIDLEGKLIAVAHGDDPDLLDDAINSGEYDLVCTGHTHQRELRRVGRTIVLNPGALYRAKPKTFAIVDWPAGEVEFVDLAGVQP
jgi:putative phosphoesterase